MKRRLIIVNTYYQLLTAINLKIDNFLEDHVDVFITDCSVDARLIAVRLRELSLFSNVYYLKTKDIIQSNNLMDKWNRGLLYVFREESYEKIIPSIRYCYDELLFYNITPLVSYIFFKIKKNNDDVYWSRFEEGIASYFSENTQSHIIKFNDLYLKLRGRKTFFDFSKYYYFYEPEYVFFNHDKYELKALRKKHISDIKYKEFIKEVFEINNCRKEYDRKYIFFEECFFCDKLPVDDISLILEVVETVGKENIIIKLHPRNCEDRFSRLGITTNKTIGIPWEVIQLNYDFKNSVFLTISSASVLSSRLMFNQNVKTYLLFECCKNKPSIVDEKYMNLIEKLNYDNSILIPRNKKELIEGLLDE